MWPFSPSRPRTPKKSTVPPLLPRGRRTGDTVEAGSVIRADGAGDPTPAGLAAAWSFPWLGAAPAPQLAGAAADAANEQMRSSREGTCDVSTDTGRSEASGDAGGSDSSSDSSSSTD